MAYEVDGELAFTNFMPDGRPRKQETQTFTVWVRGDHWLIRMSPVAEARPRSMAAYYEVGSEGENVFSLTVFNTNYDATGGLREQLGAINQTVRNPANLAAAELDRLNRAKGQLEQRLSTKKPSHSLNQAVGDVQPLSFPQYKPGNYAAVVWLAYCSTHYMGYAADGTLPQVWPYQHPLQLLATNHVPATIVRQPASPCLPMYVVFLNDGTDFEPFQTNLTRKPLPPPFDHGYTNAVYEVLAYTNVSGLKFPISFVLNAYSRQPGAANSSNLWRSASMKGNTGGIRLSCTRTHFLPDLAVATLIQDNRVPADSSGNHFQYIAQPGPWPGTTNRSELKRYQQQLLIKILSRTRQKRWFTIAVLFAFSMSTLLLAFRGSRKRIGNKE